MLACLGTSRGVDPATRVVGSQPLSLGAIETAEQEQLIARSADD
jgi:hypothetical protein